MNKTTDPSQISSEVISAFEAAVATVMQEWTQLEVLRDEAIGDPSDGSSIAVMATMRLMRSNPGVMTLVLNESSARTLAAKYLPEVTPLTDSIVDDVAGELANVIAGQAKTILKGTPYHFTLSTPVVTRIAATVPLTVQAHAMRVDLTCIDIGKLQLFIELTTLAQV